MIDSDVAIMETKDWVQVIIRSTKVDRRMGGAGIVLQHTIRTCTKDAKWSTQSTGLTGAGQVWTDRTGVRSDIRIGSR